jgi:phage terminase large subunit
VSTEIEVVATKLERLSPAQTRVLNALDRGPVPLSDDHKTDPFLWAQARLGVELYPWAEYDPDSYVGHTWDGTPEPLWTAARTIAEGRSVAVLSATGVGKTYFGAAGAVLWWLDCFPGSQVVTLAPKKDQLTLHIWKEIGRLWPLFKGLHPEAELDTLRIRMRPDRDDWGAVGFPVGVAADEQVANKARGFHAEHLLFVLEETTGIHPAILAAVKLTCTAPHNLRLFFGNPDSDQDSLAQAAREPGVVAIRASALDHPNVVLGEAVIPGATSRKVIEDWRLEYGEDSRIYQSRARGIAPGQALESLIRRDWVTAAMQRTGAERAELQKVGQAAVGVDCANSENGDKAAYARGIGAVCVELKSSACPDINEWVRHHVWPLVESQMVSARRVGVDSVGVGAGGVNELRRLGAKAVQPLNSGEGPWEIGGKHDKDEEFKNLRAQMWWQLRKDLQAGRIALPNDPELVDDLCVVQWQTRNGKIVLEEKEDFKRRLPGRRSPDKGDAVVMWNWVRQFSRSATLEASLGPLSL